MKKNENKKDVQELNMKCQCCWASDQVCQYCYFYEYYRDAYRCRIDDSITGPRRSCSSFRSF